MTDWWTRLRTGWRRQALEDELREEIDAHLQIAIDEAEAGGQTAEQARRAFGNRTAIRERARDAWGLPALESLVQDLRYAARTLRRSPGFTITAVVSLAMGIGANAGLFAVLDAIALRPLPVHNPSNLVLFSRLETNGRLRQFSYAWYDRLRDQPAVFADVSASWTVERYHARVDASNNHPDRVTVTLASGNYFSTLGLTARSGRVLTTDDDLPGSAPVVVISDAFSRRTFGTAVDPLGRTVHVHATTYTVVGVTPPGFDGENVGRPTDLWIPFARASQVVPEMPGGPTRFPAMLIGRLKDGVTLERAQSSSNAIFRQIVMEGAAQASPQHLRWLAERRLLLESMATGYAERRAPTAALLALALGAAGVVLLIVCVNIATLTLARAASRRREIALRLAIGAGRGRLLRQFVTEAVLLSGLALPVALAIASATAGALTRLLAARTATAAAMSLQVSAGVRLYLFTAALGVVATILFSIGPAMRSANLPPGPTLGDRTGIHWRQRLGRWLIVSQVALTVLLLSAAGLLDRTVAHLRAQDLGFQQRHLLLIWVAPIESGRSGPQLIALADAIRRGLGDAPDVRSVAISNGGVLEGGEDVGGPSEETLFEGVEPKAGLTLRFFAVTPGFFETVGLPIVAGRGFAETESAAPVAVVGERLARFIFGDRPAIGRRFGGPDGRLLTIVGVVRDAKAGSARDARGLWYVPYAQNVGVLRRPWCIAVATTSAPTVVGNRVLADLARIDPDLPVLQITTIEGQLGDALAHERLLAALSALAATIAAIVACIGVYSTTTYSIACRRLEIGVRLAVGATATGMVRMVLRDVVLTISIGLAIGIVASSMVTPLLSARLFGVGPADPRVLASAAGLMLAFGIAASVVPALRASRVDPVLVLR